MSETAWIAAGALFSVISLGVLFAFFVHRLCSKFFSAVLELVRLSKAGSLREVVADEHKNDKPVFVAPRDDEYEAELEELMVRERVIPPHEREGPRLRNEE